MLRMLGLFGCFCVQGGCFWGGPFPRSPVCGQKDFSSFVACSFVRLSRSQCLASRPRGSVQGRSRSRGSLKAQTLRKLPKPPPQRFKCVVEPRVGSPSPRSCLCTAPRCGSRPDRAGATDRSPGPSWSTTRPRCGPCPGRAGAAAYHYCTPAPCSGPRLGKSRSFALGGLNGESESVTQQSNCRVEDAHAVRDASFQWQQAIPHHWKYDLERLSAHERGARHRLHKVGRESRFLPAEASRTRRSKLEALLVS